MSAEMLDEAWRKKLYHSGDTEYTSTSATSEAAPLSHSTDYHANTAPGYLECDVSETFEGIVLGLADLMITAAEIILEDEAGSSETIELATTNEAIDFAPDSSAYLTTSEAGLMADGSTLDTAGDMGSYDSGSADSGPGAASDSGASDGGAGGSEGGES